MKAKKILAAKVLKTAPEKVVFREDALTDIKKAITRSDIRGLIAVGKISRANVSLHSRAGARRNAQQKKKGRRNGRGSKKGSGYAVVTRKEEWMARIRAQRRFLQELREKKLLSPSTYRSLYQKSKGGFFRNTRHIKLYITELHLVERDEGPAKK
jgi:large subunit ribosomal protein L19e